jgi:hypothetical protein
MPSTSGARSNSRDAAASPEAMVNRPCSTRSSRKSRAEPLAEALEPVTPGRHVGGACDRRDPAASTGPQVLGGQASAGHVVVVDVGDLDGGVEGSPTDDDGDAGLDELLGQAVAPVLRDEQDTVGMPTREVARQRGDLTLGLGHRQRQLHPGAGELLARAPHDLREERVPEDTVVTFGCDEGDAVGAPGHERPGRGVGHVVEVPDSAVDDLAQAGSTVVDPLTTRETVARDTPAWRATCSSVGLRRRAGVVISGGALPGGPLAAGVVAVANDGRQDVLAHDLARDDDLGDLVVTGHVEHRGE